MTSKMTGETRSAQTVAVCRVRATAEWHCGPTGDAGRRPFTLDESGGLSKDEPKEVGGGRRLWHSAAWFKGEDLWGRSGGGSYFRAVRTQVEPTQELGVSGHLLRTGDLYRELLLIKASVGQAQGCRWGEPREVENAGDSFLCFSAEWTKGGGRHPTTRSPILKNSWHVSQQDRCHRNVKIKEQGTRTEFRERWIPSSC